ncbi:Aggrecan core [Gossypium australe]|uniref:Aggrecan core n=1 Tax=Gossypium australe TaxID=47621 RepID=A0A5B6X3H4_9ROSI|nr:Aggrecan core [Gossypium australe]
MDAKLGRSLRGKEGLFWRSVDSDGDGWQKLAQSCEFKLSKEIFRLKKEERPSGAGWSYKSYLPEDTVEQTENSGSYFPEDIVEKIEATNHRESYLPEVAVK